MKHDSSDTLPTGIFEVTNLEDGTVASLTADEIVEKYSKATTQPKINQWFWDFIDNEVFQDFVGVRIKTLEPSDVFDQILVEVRAAEAEHRRLKKTLQSALVPVLENLVEAELDAGSIHKISESKAAKAQYGIVEKYLLQAGPDLKTFIPKYGDRFPKFVLDELKWIQAERARVTAERLNSKKGKDEGLKDKKGKKSS